MADCREKSGLVLEILLWRKKWKLYSTAETKTRREWRQICSILIHILRISVFASRRTCLPCRCVWYSTSANQTVVRLHKYTVKTGRILLNIYLLVYIFYRAWNSKTRTVFKKPFDSMKSYGASSQNVTCFYNKGIKRGDNLCVYRNVKTNRVHFVINGEESKISFSRDVLDHWFGYIRINSESKYSSIQLSLWADKGNGMSRLNKWQFYVILLYTNRSLWS